MAETKITYATMSGDQMEDLHREIDAAIDSVKASFGRSYPLVIGGRDIRAASEFDDHSPIDTRILLGTFQSASREQVRDAIAAAQSAYPAWSARPWAERVALLKKVADGIRARRWELAALMGYEAGKNRLECVGDVEESADLIEYYCNQIESHQGFETRLGTLGPDEENSSVLRPYGVWAVISPFNFPLALAAGPAGGALVAGNTVVFKPASATPLLGYKLLEVNPRVWTWHALCGAAGVDFPYLLWRVLHGETIPVVRGRPGVRWARMSTDVAAAWAEILRGRLSVAKYAKSLKPPLQLSIFAFDDPAPALVRPAHVAYSRVKRLFAATDLNLGGRTEHALASTNEN
jgi:hypothetical protein